MALTLKERVQSYTKDAPATDDELQSFLEYAYVDIVHKVINVFPMDISKFLTSTNGASDNPIDISDSIFISSIYLGDKLCEEMTFSENLKRHGLYAPTSSFPIAFIKDANLYSNPAPTSDNKLYLLHIVYQTITVSSESITKCPDKYLSIVCKKAAIETIQNLLSKKDISFDFSFSDAPDVPLITFTNKDLPSFVLPDSYNPIDVDLSDLFSDETITKLNNIDLDFNEDNIEVSVIPKLNISDIELSIESIDFSNISEPEENSIVFEGKDVSFNEQAPDYTNVIKDFSTKISDISTLLDKDSIEEDIELAVANINDFSQRLNLEQINIQNKLNEFNSKSAEFQAKLNIAIQNAKSSNDLKAREWSTKAQNYSSQLQKYQMDVNKTVTEWQQKEVQTKVLEFNNKFSARLEEYRSEVSYVLQKEGLSLNKETQRIASNINSYKAILAKESSILGVDSSETKLKIEQNLSKFNSDLQLSKFSFDSEATNYKAQLEKDISENNLNLNLFQSKIQSYSLTIQKELKEFDYELQKKTVDYSWLTNQLAVLTNELNSFFGLNSTNNKESSNEQQN